MKSPKLVKVISKFGRIAFVHRLPATDVVVNYEVSVYDHEGLRQVMRGIVSNRQTAVAYAKSGLEV